MDTPTTGGVLAAIAALTAAALTGWTSRSGTTEHVPTSGRTSIVAPSTSPTPEQSTPAQGTAVLLTIGDTTLRGELWDNAAARDLSTRLPLTLPFSDYNTVEKTGRLDPPLTMDGMPTGDNPNPGEIGWYAPTSTLVLYYGNVGYWTGIARLGTFDDSGIELLTDGPHDVTVTITRASN